MDWWPGPGSSGTMIIAFALAAGLTGVPVDDGRFRAIRDVDARMAGIAFRLATGNAALCRELAPTPGWAIHALEQYQPDERARARADFGFETPVAVEAVVPGGPAARVGVREDEGVVAIAGVAVSAGDPGMSPASSGSRDAAADLLARQPAGQAVTVTLRHDGRTRTIVLPASPGCRSGFEVMLGPGMAASSDGRTVQVAVKFFERYTDEEIAAVVAHELSHTILRHRVRLEAAGVKFGLLSEFGRNGRLFRRTEEEADRLSVALLYNAGYDPQAAVRFWREHGGDVDGGLFRSRTHPSSKARAEAIAAAAAAIPAAAARPYVPPLLATRDAPLQ